MSEPRSKNGFCFSRSDQTKALKTLRMKVQVVCFSFSPVKTGFLLHGRESRASFFHLYSFSIEYNFFLSKVLFSNLLALSIRSVQRSLFEKK